MERNELMALMAVVAGAVIILFPLVRALADRVRTRAVDAGVREELQAMRDDLLAEMQQARHEIADLGERMDFAERLLAKKAEPGRLAP